MRKLEQPMYAVSGAAYDFFHPASIVSPAHEEVVGVAWLMVHAVTPVSGGLSCGTASGAASVGGPSLPEPARDGAVLAARPEITVRMRPSGKR